MILISRNTCKMMRLSLKGNRNPGISIVQFNPSLYTAGKQFWYYCPAEKCIQFWQHNIFPNFFIIVYCFILQSFVCPHNKMAPRALRYCQLSLYLKIICMATFKFKAPMAIQFTKKVAKFGSFQRMKISERAWAFNLNYAMIWFTMWTIH